jgi:hypothetical protein
MTVARRSAQCCCEPTGGPNCRAFQSDCFNSTNYADFPDYCRVTGSSTFEQTSYGINFDAPPCDPQYSTCPILGLDKITTSFDVVLRKKPNAPSSAQCPGWNGSSFDRACWDGNGGTFTQTRFRREWQLCDYNRNHPGYGCGCQGPNTPANICRWPRYLYKDTTVVLTGVCSGLVQCTAFGICSNAQGNPQWVRVFGHRADISYYAEEQYTETTFEPFCNFCRPGTLPPNSCTFTNRTPAPPLNGPAGGVAGTGVVRGCSGTFETERLQCPSGVPFDPEYNAPRGFIGPAEMGDRKFLDACGRIRIRSTASGSITFL